MKRSMVAGAGILALALLGVRAEGGSFSYTVQVSSYGPGMVYGFPSPCYRPPPPLCMPAPRVVAPPSRGLYAPAGWVRPMPYGYQPHHAYAPGYYREYRWQPVPVRPPPACPPPHRPGTITFYSPCR